jgi:Raf kinase inhibitor-like YbhB/YbcL family protein
MRRWAMLLVLLMVPAVACSRVETQGQKSQQKSEVKTESGREDMKPGTLEVASSSFGGGAPIPRRYTGEGEDVSPALSWSGAPAATVEFALICDDPDAPGATAWVHWVLYAIPPDVTSLPEGSAGVGIEGKNSAGKARYHGPMPPRAHGVHHYHFKVYALDRPAGLAPGATKTELLAAMKGHILAQGETVGTYER